MADEIIDKLIFSGEFDASAFIKGIDNTIAAGRRLQEQSGELSVSIQEQGKTFDDNIQRLKKVEQELDRLQKSEAASAGEKKKLRDEVKNLTAENDKLAKSITDNISQNEKLKKQNDELQKAYARTRQEVKQFQEQAGQPISVVLNDNAVISKLQQLKNTFDATFGNAGPLLAAEEMARLDEAIINSKGEFEQISKTVDVLKDKLLQLEPGTAEFNELSAAVRAGSAVIAEYTTLYSQATEVVEASEPKYQSIRAQIAALRIELARLEDTGQEESEQYRTTQIRAARLTDQYQDMQQQIRILSSDSKELDLGLAAVNAAAVGYQTLTGAMELFGVTGENAQEAQRKLLAVMNLVQGAQQLQNLLLKEGALRTLGADLASRAYAATQELVAAALGTSAAATAALSTALLATGVGALVIGLGYLISHLSDTSKEEQEVVKVQYSLNDAIAASGNEYQKAVVEVESLRENIKLAKEGIIDKSRVVKEYNETLGKTTGEVKNLDRAEQALEKNADAYIKFTLLKAAANIALQKAAEKAFNSEQTSFANKQVQKQLADSGKLILDNADQFQKEQDKRLAKGLQSLSSGLQQQSNTEKESLLNIAKDLQAEAEKIAKDYHFDFLQGQFAPDKDNKIENVYQQKLQELKTKLAEITASALTTDDTIRAKIAEEINKNYLDIDNLLKDKKLTVQQSSNLKALIGIIGDAELTKELDDYFQKVKEARSQLSEAISNLLFDEATERIANIREENEREKATIEQGYQKQAAELQSARTAAFAGLEKDFADGIFGNPKSPLTIQIYEKAKQDYTDLYNKLADDLSNSTFQKRQDLAAKIFQSLLGNIKDATAAQENELSIQSQKLVSKQTEAFLKGKSSYEEYQKALTHIAAKEEDNRLHMELTSVRLQQTEIALRQNKVGVSDQEYDNLKKQYDDLDKLASDIQGKIDKSTAGNKKQTADDATKRIETFQKYAGAVEDIAQSIVNAWQTANDAEEKALQRSIALQDRRVTDAQKIAERGNASYLKMEEEKQQELLLKQENAARRQIAINAAIQASQLLVAITGAISKIATPGVGTAEVITNIAVVVGALASGYALVKSLQENQPSFAEGEMYVRRDARKNISRLERKGESAGRDTIPAWLDEGEAVTDKVTNKLYHPVIRAIHNREIPPEVINGVVNTYPRWRMPQPNVKGMETAIAVKVMADNRLVDATHENIREVKKLQKIMKGIGVYFNWDKEGATLSLLGMVNQQAINKKA